MTTTERILEYMRSASQPDLVDICGAMLPTPEYVGRIVLAMQTNGLLVVREVGLRRWYELAKPTEERSA